MMLTLPHKPEKQINNMCSIVRRPRRYHEQRAIDFAQLPDDVRLRRFPAEFAAIALAEVFGIKDPVLLSHDVARR